MEEKHLHDKNVILISDSADSENAEKTLYAFSSIIKIIGFIIGGIGVLASFVAFVSGEVNFLAFMVGLIACAIIIFLFLVYASVVKVFANISMSLKDITKLLNR